MSITIHSTIQERRDTTESWNYTNPILQDREQGYETDIYGHPLGMKMGDGVTHWVDLPYWFAGNFALPITRNVTAGDSQPLTIPHPGMVWPQVFYRTLSGDEYGGAHSNDNGTNIVVTGDADMSGNFADTFIVIVKA